MRSPLIERGRSFALIINRTEADQTTPVDWPTGTLTSQIRRERGPAGELMATFTVDATDRLAADGGRIVLRLTDEESAAISWVVAGMCDVQVDDGGVVTTAVPGFKIDVQDAVTQ